MKCWYCGGDMIWDSDANYDEVFEEGEGVVTFLHCSKCNAQSWFFIKDSEEIE